MDNKTRHKDIVELVLVENLNKELTEKQLCRLVALSSSNFYMKKLMHSRSKDKSPQEIIAGLIMEHASKYRTSNNKYMMSS